MHQLCRIPLEGCLYSHIGHRIFAEHHDRHEPRKAEQEVIHAAYAKPGLRYAISRSKVYPALGKYEGRDDHEYPAHYIQQLSKGKVIIDSQICKQSCKYDAYGRSGQAQRGRIYEGLLPQGPFKYIQHQCQISEIELGKLKARAYDLKKYCHQWQQY